MTTYERIKYLREKKGMTQTELAVAIGYKGKSAISKVERGENDIGQSMIVKYADALGVTPTYLLFGDEDDLPEGRAEQNRTEDDVRLLDLFHALNDEQRKSILTLMQSMV